MIMSRAAALFVPALASALPAPSEAADFQITKIADTNGELDRIQRSAINERGTVVFSARRDQQPGVFPPPAMEAFIARNGSLTSVHTTDPWNAIIFNFEINDSDLIVLTEEVGLTDQIFRGTPETGLSLFVDNSSAYKSIAVGSILGNNGKTLFSAELPSGQRGVFSGPDPIADRVIMDDSEYGQPGPIRIRADGTILFSGYTPARGTVVYAATDPVTEVFSFPELSGGFQFNDRGQILVNRFLPPEQPGGQPVRGLFTGPDPVADRLADTTGPFSDLLESGLNNGGMIAFHAVLDDGGNGIFTGPDVVADKVIATGDALFGSTVTRVQYAGDLTDSGQLVFTYDLASGEQGIAVAMIPEPAALGFIGFAALMMRRRRH